MLKMVRRRITSRNAKPRCIVIAGPNGAGKTTFATEYLPQEARVLNFLNVDLIAGGMSPLRPELAAVAAARWMLDEVDRLLERRADFAWESTLSGLTHVKRLQRIKQLGYHVELIYLRLESPQLALRRVAARVRQGGHDVPTDDLLRRFSRSRQNFETHYCPLADAWAMYDSSIMPPTLMDSDSNNGPKLAERVERALIRAGKAARRAARMHGIPLYVWENGRVVANRP